MKKIKEFINTFFGNNSHTFVDEFDGLTISQRIARDILLNKVCPLDLENSNVPNNGIDCNSNKAVHAIIISNFDDIDSELNRLAISLSRQVALLCHYPNFNEDNGKNRTKITVIDSSSNDNLDKIFSRLESENGNLLKYCPWTMTLFGESTNKCNETPETYLDVEFNIIGIGNSDIPSCIDALYCENNIISIFHNNVALPNYSNKILHEYNLTQYSYDNNVKTDFKRAKLINMIYSKGINLVQVRGIEDIKEYNQPIKTYCTYTNWKTINRIWEELPIEHKLSSLFCGDCFESRIRSSHGNINESNITKLAYTEHARWNVEKLILGYRPYNKEEKYLDNISVGQEKIAMRANLKKRDKIHIDICSCNDLIRINKEDIKYDFFLTLCIPHILKREKDNK